MPDDIVEAPAIPTTLTGKKLEVPIKRLLQGMPPEQAVNRGHRRQPRRPRLVHRLRRRTPRPADVSSLSHKEKLHVLHPPVRCGRPAGHRGRRGHSRAADSRDSSAPSHTKILSKGLSGSNDEMPWGWTEERMQKEAAWVRDHLGEGEWMRKAAPTVIADQRELAWAGRYERHSLAPGAAHAEILTYAHTDIRSILPTIQAPTLVLHRVGDPLEDIRSGRDLAARIRGARLIELEGSDHYMWAGDQDAVIRGIRNFVASVRREEADLDRVLATVLFTDLVSSTEKAAMLGDRAWAELVQRHHGIVRGLLARYKGIEIETAGDSFFATFDGPARAVRCALATMDAVAPLGVELRAGVHTGEVKTIAGKPGGLAVNIGARIGALAGPSVLLVSSTVKDLTAGSGLRFEDRGERKLKGVPGSWHIYAVKAS